MGKHSIRGITTGILLDVRGGGRRHVARHAITGGEYTTIRYPIFSGECMDGKPLNELKAKYVDITYSIAPQGPGCPHYVDKLCSTRECQEPAVAVWRRPHPGEMPPGWRPKFAAKNVVPLEAFDPISQLS